MVKRNLAKVQSGVRFSYPAPNNTLPRLGSFLLYPHGQIGKVDSLKRSSSPCSNQGGGTTNNASETWKSERSYKPFSARLAFLRGFDPLRWYQNIFCQFCQNVQTWYCNCTIIDTYYETYCFLGWIQQLLLYMNCRNNRRKTLKGQCQQNTRQCLQKQDRFQRRMR